MYKWGTVTSQQRKLVSIGVEVRGYPPVVSIPRARTRGRGLVRGRIRPRFSVRARTSPARGFRAHAVSAARVDLARAGEDSRAGAPAFIARAFIARPPARVPLARAIIAYARGLVARVVPPARTFLRAPDYRARISRACAD